jgi:DNA-binding NarL/FixJ family response regulator
MTESRKLKNVVNKRQLFLVEDHPVTAQGLANLLSLEHDLAVCGLASTAAAVLPAIESSRPDLVMVDIGLPDRNGLELIKDIASLHPQLPMLVLSTLDESLYAYRALRAGARGYVMKLAPVDQLMAAIRLVLAGDVYLSDAMRASLFQSSLTKETSRGNGNCLGVEKLSNRELEIFRLIGQGIGTRQIAKSLNLSLSTVESHRTHIKEKLDVKNTPELLRQAVVWLHQEHFKQDWRQD